MQLREIHKKLQLIGGVSVAQCEINRSDKIIHFMWHYFYVAHFVAINEFLPAGVIQGHTVIAIFYCPFADSIRQFRTNFVASRCWQCSECTHTSQTDPFHVIEFRFCSMVDGETDKFGRWFSPNALALNERIMSRSVFFLFTHLHCNYSAGIVKILTVILDPCLLQ